MRTFGLVGRNLQHSFSKEFFNNKFKNENIRDARYELFPMDNITEFEDLIKNNNALCGLNVTIPFKESILNYVDVLDGEAQNVGAVNTLKITGKGSNKKITGYNTDVFGFEQLLNSLNLKTHKNALVLGTGGAAKAVDHVLKKNNIDLCFVSRNPISGNYIAYNELSEDLLKKNTIVINTTPLGMFPNTAAYPDIPYQFLTSLHLVIDLVYNPPMTLFLSKAQKQNAYICNGITMLYAQAEKSWHIWNDIH